MNAQKQDLYDFTQASPSGQPGFEVFEDTRNACWRFHGNNVDGRPTLFSQAYASADSAQRGLKTTLRLLKKKKGQVAKGDSDWQILVQSGNHQELARSRPFETKDAASKALQYFLNVSNSPKAIIEQKQAVEPAGNAMQDTEAETPVRYAFRLFFYPDKNNGSFTGRIENINDPDNNASFQGIDSNAIMQFLQTQIKPEPQPQPEKKEPDSLKPVASKSGSEKSVNTVSGSLSPGSSSSAVVRRQKGKSTELILKPNQQMADGPNLRITKCELNLRQMETGTHHIQNGVYARIIEDGQIRIQISTDYLPFGTYYLEAKVWLITGGGQSEINQYCVKGTSWLQLL